VNATETLIRKMLDAAYDARRREDCTIDPEQVEQWAEELAAIEQAHPTNARMRELDKGLDGKFGADWFAAVEEAQGDVPLPRAAAAEQPHGALGTTEFACPRLGYFAQPAPQGHDSYVIDLLLAAGIVAPEKVEQARSIASQFKPAPQGQDVTSCPVALPGGVGPDDVLVMTSIDADGDEHVSYVDPVGQDLTDEAHCAISHALMNAPYPDASVAEHVRSFVTRLRSRGFVVTPVAPQGQSYPCAKCGATRTEAEGGKVFTVCDKCWDAPQGQSSLRDEMVRFVTEHAGTKEAAATEFWLRRMLVGETK